MAEYIGRDLVTGQWAPGALVSPEDRFWAKVDRSGGDDACWLWQASLNGGGYGKFGLNARQTITAHRMAYTLSHGPVPPGMFVCHTCDVKLCVNPAHLWLGTPAENSDDMARKRRMPTKLTDQQIVAIRDAFAAGASKAAIGRRFGVAAATVRAYIRFDIRRHAGQSR